MRYSAVIEFNDGLKIETQIFDKWSKMYKATNEAIDSHNDKGRAVIGIDYRYH